MIKSKMSLLTVGLVVAVLGWGLGKLAIDHRRPYQSVGTNGGSASGDNTSALENHAVTAKAVEIQQISKITFQEALRIAEAVVDGQVYSMERETEDGKPVIEVGIAGQEVFVDAETGEIILIDDLRQTGNSEDTQEITESLELQQLATATIPEALQAAEGFAGGQAHTVDLENEDGNLVYEVVIELQAVYVDAGNGKVLYTETIGQSDESDDSQPDSSIQVPSTEDD